MITINQNQNGHIRESENPPKQPKERVYILKIHRAKQVWAWAGNENPNVAIETK